MYKDFDKWNGEKKRIHHLTPRHFVHPREIWWCALGLNVGAEVDGKNENFERPMLAIHVYNRDTFLALPITSLEKSDRFHCPVNAKIGTVWVKLTQARVLSTNRVLRKLDLLSETEFQKVKSMFNNFI